MKVTASKNVEKTRRKILEAAFEEFYKNGFQGGSMNRIVDGAGTTKGALFHHFRGKNDLGYAVVSEVIQPHLKERWADPLALSSDPIRDLKRLFRQCVKEEIANGRQGSHRELLARDGLYARLYRLQAGPLDVAVRSSPVPVLEV